jgi:hypothetical protein
VIPKTGARFSQKDHAPRNQGGSDLMFLIGFPLLIIPFAIYNIVAFLMPGVSWTGTVITVHLVSGADWAMSGSDILITLAILLLFGEFLKARFAGRSFVDHGLSLILFLGMVAEFVLVRNVAAGTFFVLLVISFVDVIGGFTMSRRRAPPDVKIEPIEHIEPVVEPVEPASS